MSDTLVHIRKAIKIVDDLCNGRSKWTMRVPAEPDRDPDLIIYKALLGAIKEIESLRAQLDGARSENVTLKADNARYVELIAEIHNWFEMDGDMEDFGMFFGERLLVITEQALAQDKGEGNE